MTIAAGIIALVLPVGAPSATCSAVQTDAGPSSFAGPAPTESFEALYKQGQRFAEFLAQADRRKRMWNDHYGQGRVAPELVERARAIPGTWRILAVAEDWCSDSVNTIPWLALLVERVDRLDMRIIDSVIGRAIMEDHRTPDGRAATPTLLILDEDYEAVGCWIERPADLQAWAIDARAELSDREFLSQKTDWYREDGGESTIREVIAILEAAAEGSPACPS